MITKIALLSAIILLNACTTNKAIRTPIPDSPSVYQARKSLLLNQHVRWGGKVVSIENKENKSIIEIVDRPLRRFGMPKVTDKSSGRFLAVTNQFIDPENLKPGRYITVTGQTIDHQQGQIGKYDYTYPVVEIDDYKIWPVKNRHHYPGYRDPYWHDPFWNPYPYHRHGYFDHIHRYH